MNFAPSRFFRLCTVSFRSPDSMDGMCVSIPYGRMGTFVRMSGMALVEYGVAGFLAGGVGNAVVRIWAVSEGSLSRSVFLKDTSRVRVRIFIRFGLGFKRYVSIGEPEEACGLVF